MSKLRLSYQTIEFGKTDIHLCTLRDRQEYDDPEGLAEKLGISSAFWSLFGVIWPSSQVLAHFINTHQTQSLRILEIGCGIGLSSLLLNKQNADITATDYHPETEKFLKRNTLLNQDKDIPFERTDWADKNDKLGLFDLIIGSDLLYEDQQIKLLADFIQAHARKKCEVIIVDPGRGRKNKFRTRMMDYGFSCAIIKPEHTDYLDKDFNGHMLKFKRAYKIVVQETKS